MRYSSMEFFSDLFSGNVYVISIVAGFVILHFFSGIFEKIACKIDSDFEYSFAEGRINRLRYFLVMLKLALLMVIPYVLSTLLIRLLYPVLSYKLASLLGGIIFAPFGILAFLLSVQNIIKRCHDLGFSTGIGIAIMIFMFVSSGSNNLAMIIANSIVSFYLLLKKGQVGPNQYGKDPLEN